MCSVADINYKKLFIGMERFGIAVGVGAALVYGWMEFRYDEWWVAAGAGLIGGAMTYLLLDRIKGTAD